MKESPDFLDTTIWLTHGFTCFFPLNRWLPLEFRACSVTCGTGVQSRDVWCVRSNGDNLVIVAETGCTSLVKPAEFRQCNNPTACPKPPPTGVWVTLMSEVYIICCPRASLYNFGTLWGSHYIIVTPSPPMLSDISVFGRLPGFGGDRGKSKTYFVDDLFSTLSRHTRFIVNR